ncbi:unnamed protein product, partial [marine sediment metagenome]
MSFWTEIRDVITYSPIKDIKESLTGGSDKAAAEQMKGLERAMELQRIAGVEASEEVRSSLPIARQELIGGTQEAQQAIQQGSRQQLAGLRDTGRQQQQAITSGYGQGINTLRGAQESGLQGIASGFGQARQDLGQGLQAGLGEVAQYA